MKPFFPNPTWYFYIFFKFPNPLSLPVSSAIPWVNCKARSHFLRTAPSAAWCTTASKRTCRCRSFCSCRSAWFHHEDCNISRWSYYILLYLYFFGPARRPATPNGIPPRSSLRRLHLPTHMITYVPTYIYYTHLYPPLPTYIHSYLYRERWMCLQSLSGSQLLLCKSCDTGAETPYLFHSASFGSLCNGGSAMKQCLFHPSSLPRA